MYIEILSVTKNSVADKFDEKTDELRERLLRYGYSLTDIKKAELKPIKIKNAVETLVSAQEKPDIVIVANALSSKNNSSFKKYLLDTVAAAERAENKPAPKDYWKKRNKALRTAKKNGASKEELKELEKKFILCRKKSKVFSMGDFGNGYKGYCFMYKGVRIAVIPKAELTGENVNDVISLAAVRTEEVFNNSAQDYPDGFGRLEYVPEKTGFVNRFIPIRGDSGKEIGRKCAVIASFLVFVTALSLLLYNMVFLSVKNTQLNGEIQKIAHGVESVDTGKENKGSDDMINWKNLKEINDEIVGWIQIDNTVIDYPVLWHKSDDRTSQYYLKHNYRGNFDTYGSIFVDYRCEKGTDSKNVVLHGHHMNDGSMFGNLMKYGSTSGNLDFYKESPTIEFDTPEGNADYKIISVFKTNTLSSQGEFFNYMVGDFQNEKDFMNYVYNVRIRSLINCPVDVNEDDQLLTLSTCSYEFTEFRTVVVARKVRDGESSKVNVSQATLNKNAVWPQVYYTRYGGTRPEVKDFCTAYDAGQIDWYTGDYDFKDQEIKETSTSSTASSTSKSKSNNSSGQSNNNTQATTKAQPTTQAKVYLTVKFINYDGSTLSTQKVEYGKAAKAPENPVKPSDEYYDYVFKGWQLDFSNVTQNMTIAPDFEPVLKEQYRQT